MTGLSCKPAWLDQISQPQLPMKLADFGITIHPASGHFRIQSKKPTTKKG
jgi:hypothetical protein